jgi:hypothetical protein
MCENGLCIWAVIDDEIGLRNGAIIDETRLPNWLEKSCENS